MGITARRQKGRNTGNALVKTASGKGFGPCGTARRCTEKGRKRTGRGRRWTGKGGGARGRWNAATGRVGRSRGGGRSGCGAGRTCSGIRRRGVGVGRSCPGEMRESGGECATTVGPRPTKAAVHATLAGEDATMAGAGTRLDDAWLTDGAHRGTRPGAESAAAGIGLNCRSCIQRGARGISLAQGTKSLAVLLHRDRRTVDGVERPRRLLAPG
jgi:hypothetical protein